MWWAGFEVTSGVGENYKRHRWRLLIQGTINFLTGAMLDNISREPYFEELSDEIAVHCRRSLSAGRLKRANVKSLAEKRSVGHRQR